MVNFPSSQSTICRSLDRDLLELVDAIVEAIDVARDSAVDRVRSALEPFAGEALFDAEIRLNGAAAFHEGCICGGEIL